MNSDDEYQEATHSSKRKSKRVKRETIHSQSPVLAEDPDVSLLKQATSFVQSARIADLPNALGQESSSASFEGVISSSIDDLSRARQQMDSAHAVRNDHGHLVRPISRVEGDQLVWDLVQKQGSGMSTGAENILLRRLTQKLLPRLEPVSSSSQPYVTEPLPTVVKPQTAPPEVLEALNAIKTTPFAQSFASRLYGCHIPPITVFFRDWETMSPWMELMAEMMDHYRLSHPLDNADFVYTRSPISYTPIYAYHLPQVHDLLERTFWPGIDVSDSVRWEAEQCSIVASYKRLVVGCAFLSETMEPYVTYIAVRAGWESVGIATFMLYHLIKQNPNQDISLHVSATNPAMLLYNRFGFKAEEFVVGFYDDYLDEQTKLCKNALRLRYRR